jgi:PAS domain S-box-containing protein
LSNKEATHTKDRFLSQIVEGSPIPTFVIDKDHRVIHWNRACENLTGIPEEDIIGTNRQENHPLSKAPGRPKAFSRIWERRENGLSLMRHP